MNEFGPSRPLPDFSRMPAHLKAKWMADEANRLIDAYRAADRSGPPVEIVNDPTPAAAPAPEDAFAAELAARLAQRDRGHSGF